MLANRAQRAHQLCCKSCSFIWELKKSVQLALLALAISWSLGTDEFFFITVLYYILSPDLIIFLISFNHFVFLSLPDLYRSYYWVLALFVVIVKFLCEHLTNSCRKVGGGSSTLCNMCIVILDHIARNTFSKLPPYRIVPSWFRQDILYVGI